MYFLLAREGTPPGNRQGANGHIRDVGLVVAGEGQAETFGGPDEEVERFGVGHGDDS